MIHRIDELVNDLTKPIYVLRMANGVTAGNQALLKSAETRAGNARKRIHEIVCKYAEENANAY